MCHRVSACQHVMCVLDACDGESVSVWERLGEQEEGTRSKVPVPGPLMVVVGYSIH